MAVDFASHRQQCRQKTELLHRLADPVPIIEGRGSQLQVVHYRTKFHQLDPAVNANGPGKKQCHSKKSVGWADCHSLSVRRVFIRSVRQLRISESFYCNPTAKVCCQLKRVTAAVVESCPVTQPRAVLGRFMKPRCSSLHSLKEVQARALYSFYDSREPTVPPKH